MSRVTVNQLAEMMNKMSDDMAIIANVCKSLDARLTTLEEGKQVTSKVAKPTVQKPKASATTTTTAKWVLNKKCVYSAPNEWVSKNARYAFKMQAQENGGMALTEEERTALVKKLGDKYVTVRKFATEKAAKDFFTKWNAQ